MSKCHYLKTLKAGLQLFQIGYLLYFRLSSLCQVFHAEAEAMLDLQAQSVCGTNSHDTYRPAISVDALSLCASLAPNIVAIGTEVYKTRLTFHLRPSVNYASSFPRLLRTLNYVQTACT